MAEANNKTKAGRADSGKSKPVFVVFDAVDDQGNILDGVSIKFYTVTRNAGKAMQTMAGGDAKRQFTSTTIE